MKKAASALLLVSVLAAGFVLGNTALEAIFIGGDPLSPEKLAIFIGGDPL